MFHRKKTTREHCIEMVEKYQQRLKNSLKDGFNLGATSINQHISMSSELLRILKTEDYTRDELNKALKTAIEIDFALNPSTTYPILNELHSMHALKMKFMDELCDSHRLKQEQAQQPKLPLVARL